MSNMTREQLEKLIVSELKAYAEVRYEDQRGGVHDAVISVQFSDIASTLASKIQES